MGLLSRTAGIAEDYLDSLDERPVAARVPFDELHESLDGPLPEHGDSEDAVLDAIAALEPGFMGTAGPRYFGFVTGGALPVDRGRRLARLDLGPHFGRVPSPAGAAVEAVAARWVLEALGLPRRRPCRLRDRRDDGQPGRAGVRAPSRARRRRLERGGARASTARRRCGSWWARRCTSP